MSELKNTMNAMKNSIENFNSNLSKQKEELMSIKTGDLKLNPHSNKKKEEF